MKTVQTKTAKRKASRKAKAKASATKASKRETVKAKREDSPKASKRPAKGRKASKAKASKAKASRKAKRANRGGGAALPDFGNDMKIRVLKRKEIPSRAACFKSGDTVAACLAKQKKAGFRGRRKFIRLQRAAGRIAIR